MVLALAICSIAAPVSPGQVAFGHGCEPVAKTDQAVVAQACQALLKVIEARVIAQGRAQPLADRLIGGDGLLGTRATR